MRSVWIAAGLLAACAASGSPLPASRVGNEGAAALGPGDTFEVKVYGEEDLSGKYKIADDGSINFPLVGRLQVTGMAPHEIEDVVEKALVDKSILRQAHVSVFVVEQTSQRVTVMGAVGKPGSVAVRTGMTIVSAISEAGGLGEQASGDSTIVTRRVDGRLRRYRVPVDRISEGRADDFPLQAGDIVYVPTRVF